jgi:hypothetical protein
VTSGLVQPGALADFDIRTARRARLWEPHVAPLVDLADRIAAARGLRRGKVPYPDPIFGGVDAEALVLLQNPFLGDDFGSGGSGLVSLENPELVAHELWRVYDQVGLEPSYVVHWNAVPWFCGVSYGAVPSTEDRVAAQPYLGPFLELLPNLRVVLLFGHVAEEMWAAHCRASGAPGRHLRTVRATHPWLIVDGITNSQRRQAIRDLTYDAVELLTEIITAPRSTCGKGDG